MSKINNMLLLFDKSKKTETEKKDRINTEKAKSQPLTSSIQKQDSNQIKHNISKDISNPISQNTKKIDNPIANRMKMFENKNQEKTEKKIENKLNNNIPKEEKGRKC